MRSDVVDWCLESCSAPAAALAALWGWLQGGDADTSVADDGTARASSTAGGGSPSGSLSSSAGGTGSSGSSSAFHALLLQRLGFEAADTADAVVQVWGLWVVGCAMLCTARQPTNACVCMW